MSSIFGGSKSKSQSNSSNRAYDTIAGYANPMLSYAQSGAAGLNSMLAGDASGFNTYKQNTGFDALLQQGSRGITGNAAAGGLLRSGSTGKSLVNYGNMMQNQYANDYMKMLLGQAGLGDAAAGALVNAGQTSNSTSTSKSKPGIGGFLGTIGSGIAASDRRLKKNIHRVGEMPDGTPLYLYRYSDGSGPFIGVMADEAPVEALGPEIDGYKTVDYGKLTEMQVAV